MTFGNKIRERREELRMTQEDLSSFVHEELSRQSVSKWERGEAYPDVENLITLSAVLGLSLDEMFQDELSERISKLEEVISDIPLARERSFSRDAIPVAVLNELPIIQKLNGGAAISINNISATKIKDDDTYDWVFNFEGCILEEKEDGSEVRFKIKVLDSDGIAVDTNLVFTNANKKGEKFRVNSKSFNAPDWGEGIMIDIM